jgi:nucleotide-binding universal stress UspA family protein
MSTILVPHDGTEMSDRALEKATELARAMKSEILIVHIVDSRFVPPSATLGFISDTTSLEDAKVQLIRILKTGAQAMLDQKIRNVRQQGVPVRFVLGVGSPADEIVSIAKGEHAGLIVMGSKQIGKEKLTPLGSVARRVSEISACPVMIVH